MTVVAPPQYVPELQIASPDDIADLESATAQLAGKGLSADQVAARIVEAGWSEDLSSWYAGEVVTAGGLLQIKLSLVDPVSNYPRPENPDEKLNQFYRFSWAYRALATLLLFGGLVMGLALWAQSTSTDTNSTIPTNSSLFIVEIIWCGLWVLTGLQLLLVTPLSKKSSLRLLNVLEYLNLAFALLCIAGVGLAISQGAANRLLSPSSLALLVPAVSFVAARSLRRQCVADEKGLWS